MSVNVSVFPMRLETSFEVATATDTVSLTRQLLIRTLIGLSRCRWLQQALVRQDATGPEAAVHRDAAMSPQLEHKPTWRGHRECAPQPHHASLNCGEPRSSSGSFATLAAMRRAFSCVGRWYLARADKIKRIKELGGPVAAVHAVRTFPLTTTMHLPR
jgi:hypothetical protein